MRLRVHHTTTYRYEPAASGVIQVLRLTPGNHDGQYVVDWQVDLSTDSHLSMRRDARWIFLNTSRFMAHFCATTEPAAPAPMIKTLSKIQSSDAGAIR